jgi:hypothetical protein
MVEQPSQPPAAVQQQQQPLPPTTAAAEPNDREKKEFIRSHAGLTTVPVKVMIMAEVEVLDLSHNSIEVRLRHGAVPSPGPCSSKLEMWAPVAYPAGGAQGCVL